MEFAKEVLKGEISEDETIDPDSLEVGVGGIEQNEDKVSAKVSIKGFVIPKVDSTSLVKQISGKSFGKASDILEKYPQVSNTEIKLSFSLPLLPKILPFSSKNISITTKVNE